MAGTGEKNRPDVDEKRRGFLNKLWLVLAALGAVEFAGIFVAYLKSQKSGAAGAEESLFEAGRAEDFQPGTVTAFPRGGFYLCRLADGGFLAVSRQCTHLGCTVPWIEKEKKFSCPCHASEFDIAGDVLRSPAPRALDLFEIRIENNVVRVNAGRRTKRARFQKEQAVYPSTEKA